MPSENFNPFLNFSGFAINAYDIDHVHGFSAVALENEDGKCLGVALQSMTKPAQRGVWVAGSFGNGIINLPMEDLIYGKLGIFMGCWGLRGGKDVGG